MFSANVPCQVISIEKDYCVCFRGTLSDRYKIEWREEAQQFVPAPRLPFNDGDTVVYNSITYVFNSITQEFTPV